MRDLAIAMRSSNLHERTSDCPCKDMVEKDGRRPRSNTRPKAFLATSQGDSPRETQMSVGLSRDRSYIVGVDSVYVSAGPEVGHSEGHYYSEEQTQRFLRADIELQRTSRLGRP